MLFLGMLEEIQKKLWDYTRVEDWEAAFYMGESGNRLLKSYKDGITKNTSHIAVGLCETLKESYKDGNYAKYHGFRA